MTDRIGAVYMLTNTVNGKSYVGQTWATPETRWSQHATHARRPKYPIEYAIRKHGADAFRLRVLVEGVRDQVLLDLLEADCVASLGTHLDADGYNATSGGQGKGIAISEETRRKISAALLGNQYWRHAKHRVKGEFKLSPEAKAKISAARTGTKMPPRGPGYTTKMRAANLRTWSDPEIRTRRIERMKEAHRQNKAAGRGRYAKQTIH